ncbi:MAG: hypothetical protein LC687_01145, partial [Actinobacteria bacterium]|nr:hypothetical protein [Actinomycetota bacterium]
ITGYDQTSGNFTITGSGTFSTGTGDIDLNGDVTAASTIFINDGLSVAGTNTNVNSAGYFEANITTGSSVNNGTEFGPYTFDADNDPDEAAWTFVSDNGTNGLNPSGTGRAWSHETGDTPSVDVGPTSGQGGNPDGYIYTEASAPAAAGDTFTVTNNTAFDASNDGLFIEFYWNQRGDSNLATLDVQTNENGAGWVTRGSYGGGDQPSAGPSIWNFEQLNLGGIVSDPSTEVRFLVTLGSIGSIWHNDFGLDTITVTELLPDVYGDNVIEAYNANAVSDVDLLVARSDVGGVNNVKFRVDSDGDIFSDGMSYIGGGADLAEMYKNNDGAKPGDVVVFADNRTVEKTSRIGQKALAGVVSTYAGLILDANVKGVPVALSGRAPVNFSTQNGSIEKGDYLTSGPDGVAVKVTEAGPVIGTAMEDADADGSIDVLINAGYYNPGVSRSFTESESGAVNGGELDMQALIDAGLLGISTDRQKIELSGLSVGGGINNNFGGISSVGVIEGVTDITAQTLTLAAADDQSDALVISKDGDDVLTIADDGALRIIASSANALRIQSSTGDDIFNVDSENGLVYIGSPSNQAKTVLLVLSGRDEATDPPGVNGAQYYNNAMNRFRCYQEDRWQDCISASISEYILLTSPVEPTIDNEFAKLHNSSEVWIDVASASQAQLQIETASLGDDTAKTTCQIEYRDAASSVENIIWLSSDVTVDINPSSNLALSGWVELPDDMPAEVIVRLSCMNDAPTDQSLHTFNSARLQLR